MICN